ncbi:MAG TPA: BatA domain-containing protein [Flavipsychrobacter sp.]
MSFIYPLFLLAGLALAIPVLIHLFNLRRYKTVYFPHTRFLKNIQLRSQKQSQIRYKLLLALRMLFLLLLVLAFAQPYFAGADKKDTGNRLQAIYIDNSGSMSLKKESQRLVDIAKETARRQVRNAAPGTKFILLTNDRPVSYRPMPAEQVLTELGAIEISSSPKDARQVLSLLGSITETEAVPAADLYYYSDFQQSAVGNPPEAMDNVAVYAVPFSGNKIANVYIDTAWMTNPVVQAGESNELIVRTRLYGDAPEQDPVLNLLVNGQVKSAATLSFNEDKESTDTISFRVNDAAWQQIELVIGDKSVRFDDTFRITARSTPNLSVLALNEGAPSPYIQAAFRAYNGFRLNNVNIANSPADWTEYNLVIVNGCTRVSSELGKQLAKAQQLGQTVCIFPGRTSNYAAINEGLKEISDISISGIDTATQAATTLQQGSTLVRDLFESVPENVQLPVANWHYVLQSGLTANRQSILSFRNGDPLFAQYSPYAGQLYILSTGIDLQSGNFPSSYFFAPFLYQMAVQSKGGNVYAITLGSRQPAYIPLNNASERNMVKLYHAGGEAIPPQRAYGAGLHVFVDETVTGPGFYTLAAAGNDTTIVAVNTNRAESQLAIADVGSLEDVWKGIDIQVVSAEEISSKGGRSNWGGFPLWKVCVILALLMLAAETFVLAGSLRKPTAAIE